MKQLATIKDSEISPFNSEMLMVDRIIPQKVHVLIPGTCVCVTVHGKGEIKLQMESSLLINWPQDEETILANEITRVLKSGGEAMWECYSVRRTWLRNWTELKQSIKVFIDLTHLKIFNFLMKHGMANVYWTLIEC